MSERTAFEAVPTELDFPRYERAVLERWKQERIFEKSLTHRGPEAPHFVFYEGPPTANGVPHNGHVLTRVMKDLFPRYHAMRGLRVLRKGGWDTHGLPVEVEVEKELRIHGKAAIQQYGVEPFVQRCVQSVFRYTHEWERLTERIGFWVSLDDAYVTYHRSYVESVWWALSRLFDQGLLYQGHKVVWWWAQGGTALSSAEVGLGYKSVDDPSVFVAFPLLDEPDTALVVWTTTPWTLPSNTFAAVKPGTSYDVVRIGQPLAGAKGKPRDVELGVQQLIVASALRESLAEKLGRTLAVVRTLSAEELVGARYRPPFDWFTRSHWDASGALVAGGTEALSWRVIAEDFVTLDTGTGIVHVAPAFGEDDNRALSRDWARFVEGATSAPQLLSAVEPDGSFGAVADDAYRGRWVKSCDKPLIAELRAQKVLVFDELYRHDYPFCWRADEDPLIQMARPAWFIRTTALLDRAKANNQAVNWLPPHIKDGRFGDFLQNNVDWALSRERFWGTPLNVWVCGACDQRAAPSSVTEIEKLGGSFEHFREAQRADPTLNEHLIVHKPWIDQVTFPCAKCGATMTRVPEVIDCWFDSGCMPFAQWGFPHLPGSVEKFDDAFPANFICEAIDQTRGWFYSLLMISSLVFDEGTQRAAGLSRVRALPHPYETCIVLGHVCDKEGKKESKSRGNYTPPEIILDRVSMDFAVLAEAPGVTPVSGQALIAREDLEGMDLDDGSEVELRRPDRPDVSLRVRLQASKKLPRRVVVLTAEERTALGVDVAHNGLATMPVEVPRLPATERVTVEDPTTPAPGADAFRWFFFSASPPWTNTRHSLKNVRTAQKDFLVKLRNVYSFFCIYANIDGYQPANPAHAARPVAERALLDRWLLSELSLGVKGVRESLDAYLVYDAAQRLIELVEGLSNWYVRRSRARFWAHGLGPDKLDAYATLHEALVTLSKLIAPFTPFIADELYCNLVQRAGLPGAKDSVHLADFPVPDASVVDEELASAMRAVREIVSLGLGVRTKSRLKVRQPLAGADVVLNDASLLARLAPYRDLITDELNVHQLTFMAEGHEGGAVTFKVKPNFRALGPRLGKNVQAAKAALESADGGKLYAELSQLGSVEVTIAGEALRLGPEELEVVVSAAEGFAAETGKLGVVVLHTTLTDALLDEGILRELVSRIQAARKDLGLDFADRVRVAVSGSERLERVAREGREHLMRECLATELGVGESNGAEAQAVGDETLLLRVEKA